MNRLLAQFRESVRLRVLLAVVVFVIAFVEVLDLRDAAADRRVEAQRAEGEFHRWNAIAKESDWNERREEAGKRRQVAEAALWTGATPQQAQLRVQEWLVGQLKGARLNGARVTGSVQPKGMTKEAAGRPNDAQSLPSDVFPLRLGVSFELTRDSVERFAGILDASGKFFVIDAMTVRKQPLPRVELELVTLARAVPSADVKSAAANAGETK